MASNVKVYIVITITSIAAIYIGHNCYLKPAYNWDTLPYMALVLNIENSDLRDTHQKTFEIARQEIPFQEHKWLVDTTHELRKVLIENHKKFFQFSSFFRVKPAYIWLSYAAYRAGIPLSKSPVIISVFSFVLIFWTLQLWLSRNFGNSSAGLISLLIVISPPVLEAARLSTPDMLSTFVLLAACHSFFFRSNWIFLTLALTISILVRADNVLFCVIIFAVYILHEHHIKSTKKRLVTFISITLFWICLTVAILWNSNFQNGLNIFYGGLFQINPWKKIVDVIRGLKTIQTSHLPLVLLICFLALPYNKVKSLKLLTIKQSMFIGLILYVVTKFILFPDLTTRFYLPVYIVSIVFIIEEINFHYKSSQEDEINSSSIEC